MKKILLKLLKIVMYIVGGIFYTYSMLIAMSIIAITRYDQPQSMRDKVFIIGFFLLQLLVLGVIYRQIYKRVFKKTKKLTEDNQKDRIKTKKKVTFFACLTIGILAFWIMLLFSETDEINTETIVIIETEPPIVEESSTHKETIVETEPPTTEEISTQKETIIETEPPTTEKITTQEETPAEIIVHITNTGSKYHRAGCQYLRKSDIPISLENAKKSGYAPCSRCNPPR